MQVRLMGHDVAERRRLTCSACNAPFDANVPAIVDGTERPDLVERLREGTLHHFTCPACAATTKIDAPALLYRPSADPVLLFVPGRQTTAAQDNKDAMRLLTRLRKSLGRRWHDKWVAPLTTSAQEMMRFVLSKEAGGFEPMAVQALANAALAFCQAGNWDEAHRIVQAHPDLLSPLADRILRQLVADQPVGASRRQAQSAYDLLVRSRQVGVENAFTEKLDSGAAKREMFSDDVIEALRAFMAPPTWSQSKEVIVAHRELLLGDAVDDAFAVARRAFADNADMLRFADDHLRVIEQCRGQGIDPAFAALHDRDLKVAPVVTSQTWRDAGLVPPDDRRAELEAAFVSRDIVQGELAALAAMALLAPEGDARRLQDTLDALRGVREGDPRQTELFNRALTLVDAARLPAMSTVFTVNVASSLVRSRTGDRTANLESAIAHCRKLTEAESRHRFPGLWALAQSILGEAYRYRTLGDHGTNIEQAIACHELALQLWTRDADPRHWAMAQHDLGAAYVERVRGVAAENIERSIEYYERALEVRTEKDMPREWASTQTNLGNAHILRVEGDPTHNQEEAIECYRRALRVFTRESDPWEWANNQNSLGAAYRERIRGPKADNASHAIACHERALLVWTRDSSPREWAMAETNLANDYTSRMRPGSGDADQAIAHYGNALHVYSIDRFPRHWADIQINLGTAYGNKVDGKKAAISHLRSSLTVYTREDFPDRWATVQFNLATTYAPDDVTQAIACCENGLAVFTPDVDPKRHRKIARFLGDLYFRRSDWRRAVEAFRSAIAAGRLLYEASATPEARQADLEESGSLVADAAYSLAKLGWAREAVEILEQGLARALSEALTRVTAVGTGAAAEDREAHAGAWNRVNTLEAESRVAGEIGKRSFLSVSEDLRKARVALSAIVARIGTSEPGVLPSRGDYASVSAAAQAVKQPIVYIVATTVGSLALIVPPERSHDPQVVWIDAVTSMDLDAFLVDSHKGRERCFLQAVLSGEPEILREALDAFWSGSGHSLSRPIVERLRSAGHHEAVLIPLGMLSLLPLHAVCGETEIFRYAPSAQSAHASSNAARDRERLSAQLLAIGDPSPNPRPLPFSRAEVAEIARHFEPGRRHLLLAELATRERVVAGMVGATHLHFACHGQFDANRPLASALFLAGRDTLTLLDVLDAGLDLTTARIVVLSACQTAVTDFLGAPYEAFGFPAGFLRAGVPGVICTLWPVDDLSTAVLMGRFYEYLRVEALDAATALHRAQHWLRTSTAGEMKLHRWYERAFEAAGGGDPAALGSMRRYAEHADERPFAHPYFWAGFVFAGAGS